MTTQNSHDEIQSGLKDLISAKVSRRGVFAGIGGLSAAAFLASCGSSGGSTGGKGDALRWGNWPLYLDFDSKTKKYPTLEAFIKKIKKDKARFKLDNK